MSPAGTSRPSFGEATRFWLLLGFVNFGGPTGQIALMREELVERRRWIDGERFMHALSFCMLLPGPEAHQLAIYIGWLLHGTAGGIVAGALFVAPASILMFGLAWAYAAHGDVAIVASVFGALSAAVVGIVAAALVAIAARALPSRAAWIIAASASAAISVIGIPFPFVILSAAAAGLIIGGASLGVPFETELPTSSGGATLARALKVAAIGLVVWWAPLLALGAVAGFGSVPAREGFFFSQVAVVTFGGAYAVLAYIGREVTVRFGLDSGAVVAGLGLAETTPGPLILVVEFLGFLIAYRHPGSLPPVVAGGIGAVVTLWATFVPSFVWIFVGAPFIERLRANRRLRGALAGITAAVVGVIASLALAVGTVALFSRTVEVRPLWATIQLPHPGSIDVLHVVVAVAAFVAIRRFKAHVVWIALASAALGLLAGLVR